MILVLGASGYIGSAFCKELSNRATTYVPFHVKDMPLEVITDEIASKPGQIDFVINAAAFIPPSGRVDDCKDFKSETMRANVYLPDAIAQTCKREGIAMAHISTGCLYDEDREYAEDEEPTRKGNDYGGFYVSTKYLSEKLVRQSCPQSYVWRIRLPFDEFDHPKNYLTKLRSFKQVWHQTNSLTHRGDFVKSAMDMVEREAPWGVYHMTNKGSAPAIAIVGDMRMDDKPIIQGPVPGCRLSTSKLEAAGCGMRPVADAVEKSLRQWKKTN